MISKQVVALTAASVFGLVSAPALAQHHHGGHTRVVVTGGYYASPFWYGAGWYPYWYGAYGPYGPYGPYPNYYPYYSYDPSGSLKLEVTPKDAEVYVDGYYAGIVDDFDGAFQRLHVLPGNHELTLYKDGMQAVHQKLYLAVASTFKVKYAMQPLAAGAVPEARPVPPPEPSGAPSFGEQAPPPGQPAPGRAAPQGSAGRLQPPPPADHGVRVDAASPYGAVVIRVQPGGATIMIDSERWEGPQGDDRLVLQLAEGPHRIEVRKDGFESFTTDITVRRGETTPLNVSLRR